MDPTDRLDSITPALERQDRLDAWAKEAALCIRDGCPTLARLCLLQLDCIRRETEIRWEAS